MPNDLTHFSDRFGRDGQLAAAMVVLNLAALGALWLLSIRGSPIPTTAAVLGLG